MKSTPLFALVALSACIPQNAEMTQGRYEALMALNTSQMIAQDAYDFEGADETWNVDCRELDDETDRLPNVPEDACRRNWANAQEAWVGFDAYMGAAQEMDPWRGEGIITSEGDFQVTFHQSLPGGTDLRFAFVVDPVFQPVRCTETAEGVSAQPIDGDWLAGWSGDVDSGTLYYLNSFAYQFDPDPADDDDQVATQWFFPQEWRAGFAHAVFGEETLVQRTPRYADPACYLALETEDTYVCPYSRLWYTEPGDDHEDTVRQAERVQEDIAEEMTDIGFGVQTMVHDNAWRTPDEVAPGIDGWAELNYSWVRLDPDADLTPGGHASGDFHILFDGAASQTRVVVTGSFNVDRIKRDRWVTDDIQAAKREEYNTQLCVP